jgi:plastocyanin domain-containing protein
MTAADVVTIAGGALVIVAIALFFWRPRRSGTRTATTSGGYQEAMVLVKGGYTPDVIVVQRGRPVRLDFRREETGARSEIVVLGDVDTSAPLPAGETVTVELLTERPGTYEFACQMGMLRGRLVVKEG